MHATVEPLEHRRLLTVASPAAITFGSPVVTAVAGATAPVDAGAANGYGTSVVVATADPFDDPGPAAVQRLTAAGGGGFTAAASFRSTVAPPGPWPFAAGDFTGDGPSDVDLAFDNPGLPFSAGTIETLTGDSSFASAATTDLSLGYNDAGLRITAGAAGDFNGDGSVDLAMIGGAVGGPERVLLLPTHTNQAEVRTTLAETVTAASLAAPQSLTVADLNGDAYPDLVWFDGSAVHPLLASAAGTFTEGPAVTAAGDYAAVAPLAGGSAAVDDVIVTARSPATYQVLRNDGTGTLTAAAPVPVPGVAVTAAAAADLNDDGVPDLDVGGAALAGRGDGTFAAPTVHATLDDATGLAADRLVVADQTGDGLPDLVGYAAGGAGVETLVNTTTVTARAATTVTLTTPRTTVRLGDLVTITALLSAADAAAAPAAVPTGNVAFSVNGAASQNALVEDGSTFFGQQLPLGTDTVTATYGGDDLYATAAATPITVTVLPVAVTSTVTVGASTRQAAVGAAVTLVAQVLPAGATVSTILPPEAVPTGTVTFATADGTDLGTAAVAADGSAELTTAALPLGADTVNVAYTGDDTYTAGTSTAGVVVTVLTTVPPYPTTVTVIVGQATATEGDAVVLLANVTSADGQAATGTVTFTAGGVALGSAPVGVDGQARLITTALPAGSVPITAAYAGDATHAAGTSANAASVAVAAAADDDPSAGLPAAGGSTLPAAAVAGATVRGVVTVGAADPLVRGPARVTVMLVPIGSTAAATTLLARRASVSRSGTVAVPVRAAVPATLAVGTYAVQVAVVNAAGTTTFAAGTLAVAARTVDLTGSTLSGPTPATVRAGGRVAATLTLANAGTVDAVGRVDVVLTAAPAGDASAVLATVRRSVAVRAGGTARVRLSAAANGVPAGVALSVSAAVSFTPKVPGTAATATLTGPGTFTVLAGGPT